MYEYKGYAAKVCASDLDANGVGAQLSTTLKLKQRHYNLPLTLPPLRDNDGLPGHANKTIFLQLRGNPKALLELGQDTCIPLPLWTPVADLGHKVSKLLCH